MLHFHTVPPAGAAPGAPAAVVARGADPAVEVPAAPTHFCRRVQGLPLSIAPGALVPLGSLCPLSILESIMGMALNTNGDLAMQQVNFLTRGVLPEKLDAAVSSWKPSRLELASTLPRCMKACRTRLRPSFPPCRGLRSACAKVFLCTRRTSSRRPTSTTMSRWRSLPRRSCLPSANPRTASASPISRGTGISWCTTAPSPSRCMAAA